MIEGNDEALRNVRGLLFDYGNTLIRYGRREDGLVMEAFYDHVLGRGHAVERDAFFAVVREVTGRLIARATATGVEVDRTEKVREVLGGLDLPADDETIDGSLTAISAAFVDAIESSDELIPRLTRLGERFQLGLLSNYYLGPPIHDSLEKIGIAGLLEPRVVSADIGWCKPHPKAFEAAVKGFDCAPGEILMVGDNLTADIAGGKKAGLLTAHTSEHLDGALDYGSPQGDGTKPDVSVASLAELETLLMS